MPSALSSFVETSIDPQVWMMLAVGDERGLANHDGYADDPSQSYEWTDAVNNGRRVREGDVIFLRDKESLLGVSVIDSISTEFADRASYRCPDCGSSKIKERSTMSPRYRCQACASTFDKRRSLSGTVMVYRSEHGPAWTDLAGFLGRAELKELQIHRDDQNAIRPMDADRVVRAIPAVVHLLARRSLKWHVEVTHNGHVRVLTRARIGQADFRNGLLTQFGSTCAFTGPAPFQALEAAHLYSYAALGRHDTSGGLLLRRDLHRLFDDGQIAVRDRRLDVAPETRAYPTYGSLHDSSLRVPISAGHESWLDAHWKQHRANV